MNFNEVLKILFQRFSDSGIAVALSGGLALSTMGVFRFSKKRTCSTSGSMRLSDQEKAEMLEDARSAERRAAFRAARAATEAGTLDDYIDFLSANMPSVPPGPPRVHVVKDYRL